MSIAMNLKHWRQVRGLTQPELAERAEIEQSYLSKLENGRSMPSDNVRQRLAEALGIDTETLERDPSANGHMRRNLLIVLLVLAVLGLGFAGGYFASGYEVRKVNREGVRLDTVWSLAPDGVTVDGVQVEEPRDGRTGSAMITGKYVNADSVPLYAKRLLDSGLLGTHLQFVKLNRGQQFVISISGEKTVPQNPEPDQAGMR